MQIKIKLICRLEKDQNQGLITISTIKELKFFLPCIFILLNFRTLKIQIQMMKIFIFIVVI